MFGEQLGKTLIRQKEVNSLIVQFDVSRLNLQENYEQTNIARGLEGYGEFGCFNWT